jgi:hypothetical protein
MGYTKESLGIPELTRICYTSSHISEEMKDLS